jgi:hypothetical protein
MVLMKIHFFLKVDRFPYAAMANTLHKQDSLHCCMLSCDDEKGMPSNIYILTDTGTINHTSKVPVLQKHTISSQL